MTRRAWNILVSVYSLLTNEICLNLWKLTALSLSSLFHAFTGKETASTNAAWIALVKYILQTLFSKNRIEDDRGNVTVIADEKVLKAGNPPLIYTSLPMPSSFPEVMGNQSWPIYLPIYQFAYLSSCNDYSRVPALVLAAGKKTWRICRQTHLSQMANYYRVLTRVVPEYLQYIDGWVRLTTRLQSPD